MLFMEDFVYYLKFIGSVILIYIILYLIYRLLRHSGSGILSSQAQGSSMAFKADHYYYLPAYGLKLDAIANVQVTSFLGNTVPPEVKVLSLNITASTSILPDTSQIFAIKYHPDYFSTDDFKIVVSESSLLENISLIADDQFSEIIATLTDAPEKVIDKASGFVRTEKEEKRDSEPVDTIEIFAVNKTFELFPENLTLKEITLRWPILVKKANRIDFNLVLINPSYIPKFQIDESIFYGLFSRPLTRVSWEIMAPELDSPITFSFIVPDISKIVKIPITRSLFVKKHHVPKLAKGLLIENYINKPSEAEGLASIPINIAKAIVSIPAQLLKFGIERNKLQSKFEQSVMELLAEKESNLNKIVVNLVSKTQALESEIDILRKLLIPIESPINVQSPEVPPLGKLSPSEPEPITQLDEILNLQNERNGIVISKDLPNLVFPINLSWDEAYIGTWPDYGNTINGYSNCVLAAMAHLVICWTSNTLPSVVFLDKKILIEIFSKKCYSRGCKIFETLLYWKNNGINTNKIVNFAKIRSKNIEEMKRAIVLFGGIIAGFQLPKSAQEIGANWMLDSKEDPNFVRSKKDNGHAVAVVGFTNEGLKVISWGKRIEVSWEFFKEYNDENYIILSNYWVSYVGISPEPSSRTISELDFIVTSLKS